MKNYLLSGAFVLASFFNVQAQEVLLSNNFGTDVESLNEQLEGWINNEFDDDEQIWGYDLAEDETAAMGFTGGFALSSSFFPANGSPAEPGNFLLSPKIDLTSITAANLKFKVGSFGQEGGMNGYRVLVLTNNEVVIEEDNFSINIQDVEPVSDAEISNSSADNTIQGTDVSVDLTPYVGKEVYLLFLHYSYRGLGFLMLDDIVVSSGVAGVNENLISKLSIYPNPMNDVVNVANNENIIVNTVEVTDLNGRIIKTVKFENLSNVQINVSDLASGVYMMTIFSDKGSITKKIIKN